MRHFEFLEQEQRERLFHVQPAEFDRSSRPELLSVALGATLYAPATRPNLCTDILRRAAGGVRSMVVCLEDAVADSEVEQAQVNAIAQLRRLSVEAETVAPLLFVRVRRPEQIPEIIAGLGEHAGILNGFVIPKFTEDSGDYLERIEDARTVTGLRLLAMPVIESPVVVHRETRADALTAIARLLDKHRHNILAVRIGATDLCSAFGIRRDRELTIYDVHPVASAIGDIVNVLGRSDGTGFVITGPVWEYFSSSERIFRPLLRSTPFEEHDARALRQELVTRDVDGLIREIVLDKASGLTGKTVIHPSHVSAVHALSVVTHEEWSDAQDILLADSRGGVSASGYKNKMNESKPHMSWAERTVQRAEAFGVAEQGVTFIDLLAAQAAVA